MTDKLWGFEKGKLNQEDKLNLAIATLEFIEAESPYETLEEARLNNQHFARQALEFIKLNEESK